MVKVNPKSPSLVKFTENKVISKSDKFNVITSVALTAFLLLAIAITGTGVALHFSLNLPPLIPITPNFSITIPLLVAGVTAGGAILTCSIPLVVQFFRRKKVCKSWGKLTAKTILSLGFKRWARRRLYNNSRANGQTAQNRMDMRQWKVGKTYRTLGKLVEFKVDDVKLRGFWKFKEENTQAVIVFHGNYGSAENTMRQDKLVKHYIELGFNVLAVEYRGYEISEGEAGTDMQEMHVNFDAKAALDFVLKQGIEKDKILAHGYSLGTAYAAALGSHYGVEHLVLAHPIPNLTAVVKKVMPKPPLCRSFMEGVAEAGVQCIFKNAQTTDGKLQTNQFNVLEKVSKMPDKAFMIMAKNDGVMPNELWKEYLKGNRTQYPHDGNHYELNDFLSNPSAEYGLANYLEGRQFALNKQEVL